MSTNETDVSIPGSHRSFVLALFLIHYLLFSYWIPLDLMLYFWYRIIVSSLILPVPSVLTSAAIAVDRLLALMLRLRYRHVVTLRRVRAVILCFCSIGVLCSALLITSRYAFSTRYMRFLVFNVVFIWLNNACSSNFNLLLHEDFFYSPPSSSSTARTS